MPISPHHPIRHFLFCIEGIARDEHVEPMKALVAEIATAGDWVLGPPEFVDEVQELDADDDPDWEPLRTVGGVFRLYSSLPPTFLETETDRKHYEEVLLTLKALEKFTLQNSTAIEIVLDGDTIGIVANGKINRQLERIINFFGEKAVLCKYKQAASLGWKTNQHQTEKDTRVM